MTHIQHSQPFQKNWTFSWDIFQGTVQYYSRGGGGETITCACQKIRPRFFITIVDILTSADTWIQCKRDVQLPPAYFAPLHFDKDAFFERKRFFSQNTLSNSQIFPPLKFFWFSVKNLTDKTGTRFQERLPFDKHSKKHSPKWANSKKFKDFF